MDEKTLFCVALYAAGVIAGAVGLLLLLRLNAKNLPHVEKIPRNRWGGLLFGWGALIWCIPHAQAVAPNFLLPFLLPLAIVIPILSFFYLDYTLARAVGGLMILFGYFCIHGAFEQHAHGATILNILSWIIGLAGVWISGKPCAMRDWLRKCAQSTGWRLAGGIFLLLYSATLIVVGIIAQR